MVSRISQSLNGDKVVWLAREGRKVVARAATREKLESLLEDRAAGQRIPLPKEKTEDKEDGSVAERPSSAVRSRKSTKKSR